MLTPVDFVPPQEGKLTSVYAAEIEAFVAAGYQAAEVTIPGKPGTTIYNGLREAAIRQNAPVRVMRRGDTVYLRRRLDKWT